MPTRHPLLAAVSLPILSTLLSHCSRASLEPGWKAPAPLTGKTLLDNPAKRHNGIKTEEKIIAITFDDGPHASHTPRLLKILKERGVRATFFVVGDRCPDHASVLRRIVADGHEVGNHTWTHTLKPAPSHWKEEVFHDEIRRTHDTIFKISGAIPACYRPPGGYVTVAQSEWMAQQYGYPTILWSVDPKDFVVKNAGIIQQRLVSGTKPGGILLSHDLYRQTIDAMPGTLDALLSKGYRFMTISDLLKLGGLTKTGSQAEVHQITFRFSPGSF